MRADNLARVGRVDSARKAIFQQRLGIKGAAIERILKNRSEVPTRVRIDLSISLLIMKFPVAERFLETVSTVWCRFSFNDRRRLTP